MKIFVILSLLLLLFPEIKSIEQKGTYIQRNGTEIQQCDKGEEVRRSARQIGYNNKFARNTVKGDRCIFPFMFRGVQFIDCAPGIHQPNTWCATKLNDNKDIMEWEVCALDKRNDDATCASLRKSHCYKIGISALCPLMCSSGIGAIKATRVKMTIKGTQCIFPFIHRGVHHNECASGIHLGFPWCATKIKANREYEDWEFCAPTARELASMNRFGGMNDEAMEGFVESLQEAADFSESTLDEIKEIVKKLDKINMTLGNSTSPTIEPISEKKAARI